MEEGVCACFVGLPAVGVLVCVLLGRGVCRMRWVGWCDCGGWCWCFGGVEKGELNEICLFGNELSSQGVLVVAYCKID